MLVTCRPSDSLSMHWDFHGEVASTLVCKASGTPVAPLTPAESTTGTEYVARSADGSDYNILFLTMGKAGTPYTRTVPGLRAISSTSLPDADHAFDTSCFRYFIAS
ncbi:uncharacterized protein BT62DRAFT_1000369 [Guyanagaster necrorhizus]|uniref:Uncharacterized protein n=1 Tax=Guyanagaster necrorhizus TaxID=856835 RepID=A0A9P7W4G9_9AGAR|nr:uncharacterized protein BT62DRAFT_1000369 [Guyanagaster necrorhizus MCA 3950]KAG7451136.1 hypothetical protein BT62DRAFT_1000369 [Guyanagaster necrorhizus MCA 3950]